MVSRKRPGGPQKRPFGTTVTGVRRALVCATRRSACALVLAGRAGPDDAQNSDSEQDRQGRIGADEGGYDVEGG